MIRLSYFFFSLVISVTARSEMISLPEDCFVKEVSPCLIRADASVWLKSKSSGIQMRLNQNTIVKVVAFIPMMKVEMLQGGLIVQTSEKKMVSFKINEVSFLSKKVLAQIREHKIKAFDTKSFILSEYQQSSSPEQETVIIKAEFLSKLDMIKYISQFYSQKKELLSFLKVIEPAWQKEFEVQTDQQTKVLERSVASVEKEEAEVQRQKELEEFELKKMKKLFFYRTFYR